MNINLFLLSAVALFFNNVVCTFYFSEWSSIEDEMGDPLQKAGHYMDK